MKNLKIFVLAVVAVMAQLAFVGASSASATALYNGATKLGVGSTTFLSGVGTMKQTNTAGTEVINECTGSSLKDSVTSAGGAGVAVKASISELTWTGCSVPTTTDEKGGFEVTQIGSSTEGTVKATAEIGVTTNTIFFGVCKYGVKAGNHIGVVKTTASGTADWHTHATWTKLTGSNFACPETTTITMTYVSTTPDNLRVEAS
jgi:hypothetical protein